MDKLGKESEIPSRILRFVKDLRFFSFIFPFISVILIFALMGVYPAGTKTMLTVDLYHQYMPFIYELRAKILGGRSLFYSWNCGLGNEYYAVFANYCASPLNLLSLLFPYKMLPVFVAVVTAIRAGLASLFMGLLLSRIDSRKYDLITVCFGVAYALSGWFLSDFWNIMWCDGYVLLPLMEINMTGVQVACIVFGLNSGAYISEIMRSGIQSVDHGQMEGGRSVGLSFATTMTHIVVPQAIKNILPTLGNEFISLIKETSVVSFVGATDLYVAFNKIGTNNYEFMVPYLVMALIYLVIVIIISLLIKLMERRLKKSDRRN